jgi:periplasmic protein TonB
MTATFAARASRQTVILTAIAGLHLGAFVLIASGLGPRVMKSLAPEPTITVIIKEKDPIKRVAPEKPELIDGYLLPVPVPDPSNIPKIDDPPNESLASDGLTFPETGGGVVIPSTEYKPPSLRTRDRRLAALIDACYPAAARRAGEEGRVIARISIDASGRAAAWSVAESSGLSRLDAALDCVVRQLEFVAGRRDGSAVSAEALLPIVFRLD